MRERKTIEWEAVRTAFKKIWGYEDFRAPQGEIVQSLLKKQDALIVMPTGAGKSICFQLPALLENGLTLVISPLVALMENQVKELQQKQLPAATIHSEVSAAIKRQTLQKLQNNQLRLLYLSPETLLSEPVWNLLSQPQLPIGGIILDEAHCLVQWGDTFRPAYRRLGSVRPALLKTKPAGEKIPIAAFTATADPQAQKIIKNVLQLETPEQFLINPYRPNLHLNVRITCTPRSRKQQILKFIQNRKNQAGLIYARTRRDSEELAEWLGDSGYNTEFYHAGLSPQERREVEAKWLEGKIAFVVCTSAFGMGINKPDVRWVVHFQAPALLSEYVQEVGRAGRDGDKAECLTLISEPTGWLDPEDKQRQQFFEDQLRRQFQKAKQIVKQIPLEGEVKAVNREFPEGGIALSLLHGAGQLSWSDPFHYAIKTPLQLPDFSRFQRMFSPRIEEYLKTRGCRWQFLLNAFGFNNQIVFKSCGHCDNCLRQRIRGVFS